MKLNIGTKEENEGKNSKGRLSAKEFNQIVDVIQQLIEESKTLKVFFGLMAGMLTSVKEDGFHFSDSTGKDVMNYTSDGFDAAKVTKHFISLILTTGAVSADMLTKNVVSKLSHIVSIAEEGYHFSDSTGKDVMNYTSDGFDAAKVTEHFISLVLKNGSVTAKMLADEIVMKIASLVSVEEEGYHFPDSTGKDVMNYTSEGFDAAQVSEHFASLILKSGSITTKMLASEIISRIASLVSVAEDGFHFPDSSGSDVMNYTSEGFDVAKVSDHFVQVLNKAGVTGSLEYEVINDNVYNF